MRRALVTGCAGFIGFHVCYRLMQLGYSVLSVDNLNAFYDDGLKQGRLNLLRQQPGFQLHQGDAIGKTARSYG